MSGPNHNAQPTAVEAARAKYQWTRAMAAAPDRRKRAWAVLVTQAALAQGLITLDDVTEGCYTEETER